MTLEVGEHIPARHELTVIRNLHAHNRCGILLSWACCNNGHQHVNLRPNAFVVDAFKALGYAYDAPASDAMRAPRLRMLVPPRDPRAPDRCFSPAPAQRSARRA